jgi:cyclic beta-1,2-glucan synthetase
VFVLTTIAIPPLIPFLTGIVPRRPGLSKLVHLRAVGTDLKVTLSQIVLLVTFLAHQAWTMSDAILRTLFRLVVSHRNMLDWVTAAQTKVNPRLDLVGFYRQMAGSVTLATGTAILLACVSPSSWPIAAPFLILWLLSPAVARWISLPSSLSAHESISASDTRSLRLIARRTWHFFETFVTAEDHMLPPDNFQEEPVPVVAHRTSPTNLGLYLSSVIAAHDCGWLGMTQTVERLEATLETMNRLERCRGHFYNWYDTLNLRPLDPKYISSVDSGNLAGHLIVLTNACRELATRPIVGPQWLVGIGDPLDLMHDSMRDITDVPGAVTRNELDDAFHSVALSLRQAPTTAEGIAGQLTELARLADRTTDVARTLAEDRRENTGVEAEVETWAEAISVTVRGHQRDFEHLMPWAGRMALDTVFFTPGDVDTGTCPRNDLTRLLSTMPTLANLSKLCEAATSILVRWRAALGARACSDNRDAARLDTLIDDFKRSAEAATALEGRLVALGKLARKMFDAMSFGFLFDPKRELLSIGYRVADESLDPN